MSDVVFVDGKQEEILSRWKLQAKVDLRQVNEESHVEVDIQR